MAWKKIPESAELHVFDNIDAYNKRHYPIRYFFKCYVPRSVDYWIFQFKQRMWEFKHKYIPKYNYSKCPTGLDPRHYYDIPTLMLHVNFTFLRRYVEDEKCFEIVNWDYDQEKQCVASEIEDLYYWWIYIRPQRKIIEDNLYAKLDLNSLSKITDRDARIYMELQALELKWQEEDDYNLKRLITIRNYLWS